MTLGAGWTEEKARRQQARTNTAPARENFHRHAGCYAAKLAAETILAEKPTVPDLADEALLDRFATCGLMVRPSEVHMVRDAFRAEYGDREEIRS